ncbi:hypothetical protein LIER_37136 [Lithospermum erythrorhizon]|uniref:Protein TIFY n=1 Tax=Lithospermum erythrorhizon TaxID=34254 RepID=A0AAV3PK58_LITER
MKPMMPPKLQKTSNSKGAVFHDFLGKGCSATSEASPSVSASIGGTNGGDGGGLVPISAISDLDSEQQGGSHLERVPFYGPRGVCTRSGLSSRMSGTKRSNSDSFLGSSREMLLSTRSESLEDSRLTKFLRHVGREKPRRPHDEDTSFGLQQYPPRASQAVRFGYLNSQSKSRDTSAGPSVVSQAAADEGSRTGIKGSGIWSSINATAGADKEAFLDGHGLDSTNRQMTIFYGGQAHVFDNVHPNKADAIMSLASSNGGSWSTTYAPKLGSRVSSGEHHMPITDNATRTINGIHQAITLSKETKGSNQATNTRSKEERHD